MTKLIAAACVLMAVAQLAPAQIYRRAYPIPGQTGPRKYVEPRRYVTPTPTTRASTTAAEPARGGPEVINRPTLIKSSGSYVLGSHIYAAADATTAAIVIMAPDVTLDLAGFTIVGRGATAPDAVGVAILGDRVTVRNGSITSFDAENQCSVIVGTGVHSFVLRDLKIARSDTGILLNPDNLDEYPVESGLIESCTVEGGSVGILAFASRGVTLRNCVVTGSVARRQVPGEGSGILLRGSGYLVEGCNVSNCTHGLRLDADFSVVKTTVLSNNRNTGAYISGKGNQVQDCGISGNGLIGVSVLGENCSFVNDHITGNGGAAISLDKSGQAGANHTYIKDCMLSGNSGEGVSDKGLGDTKIEGGVGAAPRP